MNWKAVIIGIVVYPLLWGLWLLLSPGYEHQTFHWFSVLMTLFNLLLPLIPGYLAAYLADGRYVQHGLLVGVIIVAMSVALWYQIGILDSDSLVPMAGILALSTLGGGLRQGQLAFQKWRERKAAGN
jgi:hypothetical protein